MDRQSALELIDAALKAINGAQRALDHHDNRIVETEIWKAQQKLKKLLEMFEDLEEKDN